MENNRAPILFALLLLLFFVSTSAGFADISSVQEQLRLIQLKVIGEKLKVLQKGVLNVTNALPPPVASVPTSASPTREDLTQTLENQIRTLEGVVATLKPRAIDEEANRIESRIAQISAELKTAGGDALFSLEAELQNLVVEHAALQAQVKQQLEDSLTYKQAVAISQEIRTLQEKIITLPRAPVSAPKPATDAVGVKDTIERLQLKLLHAQVKALQEKVGQVSR